VIEGLTVVQAPSSTQIQQQHSGVSTTSEPLSWETPQQLETLLNQWVERIISGVHLTRAEALALTTIEGQDNILQLCAAADQVRQACCGNTVDLCSIVNVKSGNC